MNKLYYIPVLLICLIVLSSPQTVFSQEERLAVVSRYNGEVKIQHGGVWKAATKIGNRIRNSSVYNGDTVLTMPGSDVDLVFSDNTTLKVDADTTLTISTRQITEEDRAKEGFVRNVSGTRQEVVRHINVKIGKLWASITPSKSVLTEFESPTGIASVRGTTLTFAFLGGITGIDLNKGLLDFATKFSKMYIYFNSGDSLSISDKSGRTKLKVEGGDSIMFKTSKGIIIIKEGGSLDVNVDPVTGEMQVVSANGVTITAGGITTDVKPGDGLGAATAGDGEGITYGSNPNVGGGGDEGDDGDDGGSGVDDNPIVWGPIVDINALGGQNEDKKDNDCPDDGDCDGVGDNDDVFPEDPTEWADSDNDGVGDNADVFPNDPTEWADSDKDDVGDNADVFPNDPTEWADSDNDGVGNNQDAFSNDPQRFWKDDFSSGTFATKGWDITENAYITTSFGPNIIAKSGDPNDKFAVIHLGPNGELQKTFDFEKSGTRHISFDYNIITSGYITSIFNGSFETGDFSGWNVTTSAGGAASVVNDSNFATDRDYYASLQANALVSRDKTWSAGEQVNFDWYFDAEDYLPYNDWSVFQVKDGEGKIVDTLTLADVAEVGNYGDSGWKNHTYTFTSNGTGSIEFGVFNSRDTSLDSQLYIDNVSGGGIGDIARAFLLKSDGTTVEFSLSLTNLTAVSGLDTSKIDSSDGYQTGWLSVDWTGPVPAGLTTLFFQVIDNGDGIKETVFLLDNVVDPLVDGDINDVTDETPTSSTDYLLAFARAIGDIDSHDMDDTCVAVTDFTSIIYSDNNFEANLDAIRDSLVVVKEFMENHINDFGDSINHNEIKAQLDSLVAKIDAARENTGDIPTLMSEIETVLVSIMGDHMAHCKENSVKCENLHCL
jgi:hypothetical protein